MQAFTLRVRRAILGISLLGLLAISSQGAVVTSTADGGAGSLREAINGGAGTITFSSIISASPHSITLLSGLPDLPNGLTINGPGPQLLTVTRSAGAPPFRIFNIASGSTVTISGLRIDNGLAQGANGTTFDNAGRGLGGGISNGGTLTLKNCLLSNNKAKGGDGADGSFDNGGSHVAGLGAVGWGGGLYSGTASTLNASDCTFLLNNAVGGTGGDNPQAGTPNTPEASGSGGQAAGGGIYALAATNTTIVRCTFASNSVTAGSAGSATNANGFGNDGGDALGGGIAGNPVIINSTFNGNSVRPGNGGAGSDASVSGFAGFASGGALRGDTGALTNCTIAGNQVFDGLDGAGNPTDAPGQGGGIWFLDDTTTLRNNIIANNSASDSPDAASPGSSFSGDYNLIRNASGWSFSPGAPHNKTGVDPLLDPNGAVSNGGLTPTIALKSGSPAINAGDDATAAAVDQREFSRSGISDMGAFELSSEVFAATNVSRTITTFTVAFPVTKTHVYRLQRATTLTSPAWTNIGADFTAASTGVVQKTDPNSTGQNAFFYQVLVDP